MKDWADINVGRFHLQAGPELLSIPLPPPGQSHVEWLVLLRHYKCALTGIVINPDLHIAASKDRFDFNRWLDRDPSPRSELVPAHRFCFITLHNPGSWPVLYILLITPSTFCSSFHSSDFFKSRLKRFPTYDPVADPKGFESNFRYQYDGLSGLMIRRA